MKKIIITAALMIAVSQIQAQEKSTPTTGEQQALSRREAMLNSEEYKNPKPIVLNPVSVVTKTSAIPQNANGQGQTSSSVTTPTPTPNPGAAQIAVMNQAKAKSGQGNKNMEEKIKGANTSGTGTRRQE
ncbi:MAG TPA: hypothetical protein PLP14_07445 [Chitinophagaceae bacterium]|nr:hypothetical protein [Chitinophagaceae bacterium]